MAATLDELGLRFGTDKASQFHNYLNFYESFMAPLREAPITLLEIGVFRGASLATWREYFPHAKIVGVDIQPSAKQYASERVQVELADQSNLEHLAELAVKHGPFDIVIEDGSHMWEHQITTLRALFPFVRNGGYYIVEDLQTNYGALQENIAAPPRSPA
jgi:cephalosporin hydroxylase